ncbi:piggyBac transposable element-derived protein 4-like [Drosophila santomea]|uniref:piggyBac transposable element-derived protein 4-like n=1 Tax=Drosophila santomea TaxID=129105 RepID=UPI001952BD2D|nr:piggyBac transposable element-derived protein 4-like [Drosophila santomea]
MDRKKCLDDTQIAALLQGLTDDSDLSDINSESGDEVFEDDVQSDVEDVEVEQSGEISNLCEDEQATYTDCHVSSKSRIRTFSVPKIRSKNKYCWSTSKGKDTGKVSAINIVQTARGPTRACKLLLEPLSCFNLFFTDAIILELVTWTNTEIGLNRKSNMTKATFGDTNIHEIRALIGILVLTAALKDNHLTTDEIFNSNFSGTRYCSTMSRDRFNFLIRCLRMDDKSLRPSLQIADRFMPVRKVWDMFIEQCKTSYTPGSHTTIDEQLLGFRGRCPFKMYIPNKPNKYGIKIVMICDSATKYMFNAIPYLGKSTNNHGIPLGEYFVK